MTKKQKARALAEFKRQHRHDNPQMFEEHNGTWIHCLPCGALWSVAMTTGGEPLFEQLEYGDESCNRR